ncbi:ATP-binding protein [Alteromonas sp. a30]|uniref:ATP-binding protein n=1 Tax=Alteromonas sp. a30 TaxID=2730917 RepID=UPI0022806FDB|nr:ATP-binding protein [Alteromonas sp. a30]MCY7294978.1 ATP-binding protein [Alteromonas sp. a30]
MSEQLFQGRIPHAIYKEQELEEYSENPFTAALPHILSFSEASERMRDKPKFKEEEKFLDGSVRVHAIARLLRSFYQPLSQHLQLEQKISLLIRQGYMGRSPKTGDFYKQQQNAYQRVMERDLDAKIFDDVTSTATSLSIFGCSGCGKSRAIERITKTYQQAIYHPKYNITQVVYLRLECPSGGDLTELCLSFFVEMDKILNTRYSQSHGRKKLGPEGLKTNMAIIANLHALGVLIIDEVQNLNEARSGGARIMNNFFVSLVNTIGIPVIQIGTPKAKKFFQSNLKDARRVTGLGSILWTRMPKDKYWESLLKRLWQYQWLQKAEDLTPELIDTMYDLTQGVMDFVVKLFVLAQARAIAIGSERITAPLLEKVYFDEFQPVHPMIDALKSGNPNLIKNYDDLTLPAVENKLLEIVQDVEVQTEVIKDHEKPTGDKAKILLSLLLQMDIDEDIAIPMVDKVMTTTPDLPIPALINKVTQFATKELKDSNPKPEKTKRIKQADWKDLPTNDLRYIFATKGKRQCVKALLAKGIVLFLN